MAWAILHPARILTKHSHRCLHLGAIVTESSGRDEGSDSNCIFNALDIVDAWWCRVFVKVTTRTPNINAGDEKELPLILLKDPAP
ncbi:MAG: hypothetical protein IJ977_09375, partial [Fibrobacter sp.]|nr:hypothetical protein [Fibrobacter sp.]